MSQEDNPSPQGDSTSETSPPSEAPNNQVNSAPVTEPEKTNNPTAGTLNKEEEAKEKEAKEKRNRFKEWLHNINKYITEDNPILDSKELNKKYPIETLASIFKIQEKDLKIISWTSFLLLVHIISYYFKLIYLVDMLRIVITALFLIFVIKNAYSAYQNRLIIVDSFKKYPLQFFTTIIAVGGLFALVIPAAMNVLKLIGDSSALTTAILTITGGFIAVFGLIKSHQKSELEREQLEVQKQKDGRDHTRQVHAARRDRYIEAIDKLSSECAPVRLGGMYALVGLVDEWLDDDNIDRETQLKEGQVIINNLCAYIRSPFPLAKNRDDLRPSNAVNYGSTFEEDSALLREEQEIRLSIFTEISNHLTAPKENSENKASAWNEFSYNYRDSLIFYPLGNLKFVNPDFSGSEFYGEAFFHNSEFIGEANFTHTRFRGNAIFTGSRHICITKFNNAAFHCDTYFIGVEFYGGVSFEGSMHGRPIMFSEDPKKRTKKTAFSMKNNPKEYNFKINGTAMVSKIETEQITAPDGRVFNIPVGCELFDPDNPSQPVVATITPHQ